jgi:hypothetical protein
MNKIYMGTILLCLAVFAIGPALAAFGDKVTTATTLPIATPLSPFGIPGAPTPAQLIYHVVYHDNLPLAYHAEDPVYLDFGVPPGILGNVVRAGDIRLTPSNYGAAGSVVSVTDPDGIIPLATQPLPTPYPALALTGFYYLDIDGVLGYGPNDPVYFKTSLAPATVGLNDIRITAYNIPGKSYPAGSRVAAGDSDLYSALVAFKVPAGIASIGLTAPGGAIAQLAFYNQQAQFGITNAPLYAPGDPVYLDVPPLGQVSPGDIQLS